MPFRIFRLYIFTRERVLVMVLLSYCRTFVRHKTLSWRNETPENFSPVSAPSVGSQAPQRDFLRWKNLHQTKFMKNFPLSAPSVGSQAPQHSFCCRKNLYQTKHNFFHSAAQRNAILFLIFGGLLYALSTPRNMARVASTFINALRPLAAFLRFWGLI